MITRLDAIHILKKYNQLISLALVYYEGAMTEADHMVSLIHYTSRKST